ncbi:TPA: hypothetical protein ACPWMJ_003543 [Acinetobacter baumannii]|uniref:Uncharacterized protein n=1 Tax=Acinetobacter junii TaxID=40215 RepID=A0AAX1MLY0_ACIJU|nr:MULTISPECIES: hypothetical protein [Acinetobacter]QUY38270.1 hypothetical protein H2677_15730 [Acinetobacter junii]
MSIKFIFVWVKILGLALISMLAGYKIGGFILSLFITDFEAYEQYKNFISLSQFSLSLLFGLGIVYIYKDELKDKK